MTQVSIKESLKRQLNLVPKEAPKTPSQLWTRANLELVEFEAVPIGAQFAYAAKGAITLKRNVFTKTGDGDGPNAKHPESATMKLHFVPHAKVFIPKGSPRQEVVREMNITVNPCLPKAERKRLGLAAHTAAPKAGIKKQTKKDEERPELLCWICNIPTDSPREAHLAHCGGGGGVYRGNGWMYREETKRTRFSVSLGYKSQGGAERSFTEAQLRKAIETEFAGNHAVVEYLTPKLRDLKEKRHEYSSSEPRCPEVIDAILGIETEPADHPRWRCIKGVPASYLRDSDDDEMYDTEAEAAALETLKQKTWAKPPKTVELTCKRCGNTERMNPKGKLESDLIERGVCSVDCANLLTKGSVKKRVKERPAAKPPKAAKPSKPAKSAKPAKPPARAENTGKSDKDDRTPRKCTVCGAKFWGTRAWGILQCSAACNIKAQEQEAAERDKDEPTHKSCPHCGKHGSIDELFGWRILNKKRKPQSRCKKCR
jgi:hypothetical protein